VTAVSARAEKLRIMAVEIFRGPDHMAMRIGLWPLMGAGLP
jgi:hypothetical protein